MILDFSRIEVDFFVVVAGLEKTFIKILFQVLGFKQQQKKYLSNL